MKTRKTKIRYLIIFSLFAAFTSCNDEKLTRYNVICFIDYSGSLKDEVLNNYAKIISQDVYGNLKSRDKIVLLPIDEGAKTNAVKLFDDDLSTHKEFSKQNDGLSHKQDSIKTRVSAYLKTKLDSLKKIVIAQKLIRKKFTNETDIVSAIEQGALLIDKNTDASKYNTINVFVFFSDMLHESSSFNLRTFNTADQSGYDKLLQKLKEEKHIPELKNVVVFVNGRTGANNQVVEKTQYFWEQYFINSNAELKAYDFDCSNAIIQFIQTRQ